MASFRYWNENPSGKRRNDCVTRAITLASGLPYSVVRKKLFLSAQLMDCPKLCVTCYSFLIQNVLGGIPKNCEGMTVEEFADNNPRGTYLVRMNEHISTIIDNCIYDTFDCRRHFLTNAWVVK